MLGTFPSDVADIHNCAACRVGGIWHVACLWVACLLGMPSMPKIIPGTRVEVNKIKAYSLKKKTLKTGVARRARS